jgi:ribonuclease P protein component
LSGSKLPVEGFGPQHRLLAAKDYSEVFATRRVLRGVMFALHYRSNALSHPRLGLVIPKKQARAAVLRNAVKRQTRELFRRRRDNLPAFDLILRLAQPLDRPKRVIDNQAKANWRAEINALFDQLCRKVV